MGARRRINSASAMASRWRRRRMCVLIAELPSPAALREISATGAFLETNARPALGTNVELHHPEAGAIAGVVQGLSEALAFAKAAGLDASKVFDAVSGGAAQSWQMLNRWQTMDQGEFDFGFAVDWMRKDLGLALDEARGNGASLPVAALVDQFYAEVQAMGGARQDTSSLLRRLTE